jgi:hypothetical protein
LVVALVFLLASPAAAADSTPRPFEVGASIGYVAPLGYAERGSKVSDTSFGGVPLALEVAYRLTSRVGIVVHAQYALMVPTLCANASDCEASLGSDVDVDLAARFRGPKLGPFVPLFDLGLGYEWLTTRLVDANAQSTRGYAGPLLLVTRVALPLRLADRWTLGPVAGASLGTFTSFDLRTTAQALSGDVPWRAPHAWLSLGVRLGFAF